MEGNALWNKLEEDEFLRVFLHGKYDVKIHEQISHGLAVSEQLAKLTEAVTSHITKFGSFSVLNFAAKNMISYELGLILWNLAHCLGKSFVTALCALPIILLKTCDKVSHLSSLNNQKNSSPEVILRCRSRITQLYDFFNFSLSLLDKELQRQVTDHYKDLLSQGTWIEKLEGILKVMHSHIQCLLSQIEGLRSKISEPYSQLQGQTMVLTRMHSTCDLLRRINRVLQLSKRLQSQMQPGSLQLIKASQSLDELAGMSNDVDLSGLKIIEEDQKLVKQIRIEVENQATQLLTRGFSTQNQSQVETALQVFHNLGTLNKTIDDILTTARQRITSCAKEELDIHNLTQSPAGITRSKGGPGRTSMVTPGNSAAFRTAFWQAIERILDRVRSESQQIELLRRHLISSSTTHPLPDSTLLACTDFWDEATKILGQELQQASQGSTFIQQAVEGEYPKFLRLYLEMCSRMRVFCGQLTASPILETRGDDAATKFAINRHVIQSFENAYLSRSMARLFDPVNLMFTGTESLPSHEEVDTLLRTMSSELSVSLVDAQLSRTVANNVGKTIKLFCTKCEHLTVTGGEATQVIEPPTPGQIVNAALVSLLQHLDQQVRRTLANMSSLPNEAAAVILEALESASNLAAAIMKPILSSVGDAVEAILLTMHAEDFSQSVSDEQASQLDAQCSLYMKELQGFLLRVSNSYLALFRWHEVTEKCVKPVAERCLELFVRLACLVRPLGEFGRMKLAADFAQVELAVASLCPASVLGRPYRILRSVRPLLFQITDDVAKCPALGNGLPHSLVLTLLFSRAPAELLSPHQSACWSVSRYSHWLDDHRSERERLELIGGALQQYQKHVSDRGETHFHSIYPVMVTLLEAGSKST